MEPATALRAVKHDARLTARQPVSKAVSAARTRLRIASRIVPAVGWRSSASGLALAGDRRGIAALEFALVGPLVVLLLIATVEFSLAISSYVMLNLAASEAARAGMTGFVAADKTRRQMITETVARYAGGLIDPARLTVTVEVHQSLADTRRGEPFRDANGNGVRDEEEWFADVNDNGVWDARIEGEEGLGGPDDIVLYTLDYGWRFFTPVLPYLLGGEEGFTISASLAIRNEPYPDGL